MNRVVRAAQLAAVVLVSLRPGAAQSIPFVISSEPTGAELYVDEKLVGVTPLPLDRPAAGLHRIRFALRGYLDNARVLEFTTEQPTALHVQLTPDSSGAPSSNWFARRKWVWIGAAGGAAGAALFLSRRDGPPPVAGSAVASPSVGLQSGTPIMFASQGASIESGKQLQYSWEFGDGLTGSGPLTTHVYNGAGSFTATLTVTAGNKSATAVASPVSIRSLNGTWRGVIAGAAVVLVLAQNGANISGTYAEPGTGGTVTGIVGPTSPRINLTITTSSYTATYAANPTDSVDALTGIYREQGLTLALTLTRE